MTTLSPAAVDQYWRDGYCVARGCVDAAAIDDFMEYMDDSLRHHLRRLGLPIEEAGDLAALHENLVRLHQHDQRRYVAMLRVFGSAKSAYDVLLSPGIADACRALGVSRPMLHTLPIFHLMSNRLRISGGYHGFEAHQDWSAVQTSINSVAVWLPFHALDYECFPLEVLPGSHLRGLLPCTREDDDYRIDPSCIDESRFLPLEMAKGDAALMTMFTVHRTAMRSNDRLRIAASWRYEDSIEPSFIERGYPFAQSRRVRHDAFSPGFPDADRMQDLIRQRRR